MYTGDSTFEAVRAVLKELGGYFTWRGSDGEEYVMVSKREFERGGKRDVEAQLPLPSAERAPERASSQQPGPEARERRESNQAESPGVGSILDEGSLGATADPAEQSSGPENFSDRADDLVGPGSSSPVFEETLEPSFKPTTEPTTEPVTESATEPETDWVDEASQYDQESLKGSEPTPRRVRFEPLTGDLPPELQE